MSSTVSNVDPLRSLFKRLLLLTPFVRVESFLGGNHSLFLGAVWLFGEFGDPVGLGP